MRYSPQHKQRTRDSILEAAGRLFRDAGYSATGVDAVMKEVGLTAGGFYGHFKSKEALFDEVVGRTVASHRRRLQATDSDQRGQVRLRRFVRDYLSSGHRDAMADGCPLPALGGEVARSGPEVRRTFEEQIELLVAELTDGLLAAADTARERVIASLALCVGGLLLARAVRDPDFSDEILGACRSQATTALLQERQ